MKRKYYLDLALKEEIVEGRPEYSLFSRRHRIAHFDVVEIVHHAADMKSINGMVLHLNDLIAGWARLSELRRALLTFRRSGKPIYCFIESGGNTEYYLASACDQIFMPPATSLHLIGLASEVFFFRELLDSCGIEPQLHAEGEFKSAAEMFTRTGMSPPSREQMEALLDDHNSEFCGAIAVSRQSSREEIARKINSGPYTSREALAEGLIDAVCYKDELEDRLGKQFGGPVHSMAAHKAYPRDGIIKRTLTWWWPRIAYVDVIGTIVSGESRRERGGRQAVGAETINGFLDHAEKSRRIRAIVVRVDSPGGTGLASDQIWRKLSLLRERKPVVFSFGDVAASGGYYIAAAGSRIYAEPTTITGSIGVLAGKFVARELMHRLHIKRESIRRGDNAEYDSPFKPFSQAETEKIVRQLAEFYRDDFVKKVAAGRRISEETADQAGRGRVWSGLRAKEQGLVDCLGGLREATEEARRLAGIAERRKIRKVHYYPRRRLRDLLMPDLSPRLRMPQAALDMAELLHQFTKNSILLWMPFRIRIR